MKWACIVVERLERTEQRAERQNKTPSQRDIDDNNTRHARAAFPASGARSSSRARASALDDVDDATRGKAAAAASHCSAAQGRGTSNAHTPKPVPSLSNVGANGRGRLATIITLARSIA